MQACLIMNLLPYPQNYDGQKWNTKLKPTRKYIPKYLHEDLPLLRHNILRQKFHEVGKFNCPKLQYFNEIINRKRKSKKLTIKNLEQVQYNRKFEGIKQGLQYALITSDRNSNVIQNLINEGKQLEQMKKNAQSIKNRRKRIQTQNIQIKQKFRQKTVQIKDPRQKSITTSNDLIENTIFSNTVPVKNMNSIQKRFKFQILQKKRRRIRQNIRQNKCRKNMNKCFHNTIDLIFQELKKKEIHRQIQENQKKIKSENQYKNRNRNKNLNNFFSGQSSQQNSLI